MKKRDTENSVIIESKKGLKRKIIGPNQEVLCTCDGTAKSVIPCFALTPDKTPLAHKKDELQDPNVSYLIECMQECSQGGIIKLGKKSAKDEKE